MIGSLVGGSFCTYNLETKEKDHIWSEKHGYQAFATNFKKGLVTLVDNGLNPTMHLYKFPEKKLLAKIPSNFIFDLNH